jgi:transposase
VTPETKNRIRELTLFGRSQREIADALQLCRASVYRAQRSMNLTGQRHGPKSPTLTPSQEKKVLSFLQSGMSTSKVARRLRIREWSVRLVILKFSFKRLPTVSEATRANIVEEILARRNYATHVADKFDVPYKTVLRIARETLGVPRFRPSRATPPLSSDFPLKEVRRV